MRFIILNILFLLSYSHAFWQYDIKQDVMRRTEKHFARLNSINQENIQKNSVKATIALIKGNITGAFIITNPQIALEECTQHCTIDARFDDEDIIQLAVIHFKDTLQLKDFTFFLHKLSIHQYLIFEMKFTDNIKRQFEFKLQSFNPDF